MKTARNIEADQILAFLANVCDDMKQQGSFSFRIHLSLPRPKLSLRSQFGTRFTHFETFCGMRPLLSKSQRVHYYRILAHLDPHLTQLYLISWIHLCIQASPRRSRPALCLGTSSPKVRLLLVLEIATA